MSANVTQPNHTEHALLVLLGQYAQHLGLIQALMDVPSHRTSYIRRLLHRQSGVYVLISMRLFLRETPDGYIAPRLLVDRR